jgi:hypothetical protein
MFTRSMKMVGGVVVALSLVACAGEQEEVLGGSQSGLTDGEQGCRACPTIKLACPPGHHKADADGDGCFDSCERDENGPVCPAIMIDCAPGTGPVDTNGDGCIDSCKAVVPPAPPACPAVMFDCAQGFGPADTNGDGCIDACVATK